MTIDTERRIFVAGHRGLVGSAIVRELQRQGYPTVLTRTRAELDLFDARAVNQFFADQRPTHVFVAAARVGGILANSSRPAEFIWENLVIETNLVHAGWKHGPSKMLFLGSSCIYPKDAPQPLHPHHLLSGPLEPTNEWYALAKIAGIKLCQAFRRQYGCDFIAAMPTNMYGPNDNYHPDSSHVLPALLRKFHEAKISGATEVVCWGSGNVRREFLHTDDFARAATLLMDRYSEEQFVNVGSGTDLTIREIAELVSEVVGFSGRIVWDTSRPDGTLRKLMDSSQIFALGWKPQISLEEGIRATYGSIFGNGKNRVLGKPLVEVLPVDGP